MTRTTLTPLQTLIDAVEVGAISTTLIMEAFETDHPYTHIITLAAFDGSLDAAKELHEALLPGWFFYGGHLHGADEGYVFDIAKEPYPDMPSYKGFSMDNPARAWLLAILKAYQAQGGAE